MEFKKERNFINAYDGTIKLGGWNISTGEFVGKSGKVVKCTPACFTYQNLSYIWEDVLSGAIRMYRELWQSGDHNWQGDYNPVRANRLEQMISLGIYPDHPHDLDSTITLTKDLVTYIKEELHGCYISKTVNKYVAMHTYYSQLPTNPPKWVAKVIPALLDAEVPSCFFIPAIRRGINEHVELIIPNEYQCQYITDLFIDYYKYSMAMWGKATVEPNLATQVCKIRKLYKDYTEAHYDDVLKANNDKPWLYFENELLIAKPLLTKAEFHAEAIAQHNCVESMYMERVHDGSTHIVSIRYKNLPEQAYVTCEVGNRGHIIQFLTACNNRVTDRGGLTFKSLYQKHLFSSLSE